MSSFIRRIQKNIAKGQGFRRDLKTGLIVNSDGEAVGKHWPKVYHPTLKKPDGEVAQGAV